MITRLLSHLRHSFARSTKNGQIGQLVKPKRGHKQTNNQIKDNKQPQQRLDEQRQSEQTKINKIRRQQQKKLRQQVSRLVKQGVSEQEIIHKYIHKTKNKHKTSHQALKNQYFQSILQQKQDKDSKIEQQQLSKLKQDMLINQIMQKQTKKKQIPITFNKQQGFDQQDKFNKQEKIINSIYQNNKGQQIKQLTFQQKIKHNYPSNIVNMAQQQKNKQLSYFKQLIKENYIVQHTKPQKLHPLHRRLKKGQTYTQMLLKQEKQKLQNKIQKKQRHLQVQNFQQLQDKQKERNKILSQELVSYEDQDYYKQKALKQFQIRSNLEKDKQSQEYLKAGQRDMQEAGDIRNIMLDQYDDTGSTQKYNIHLYQKSSFGLIDAKVTDLQTKLKKHGIDLDIQEIDGFRKQILFSQKKDREQQLAYQKYLKKKQLKNKTKEYFKKVHAEQLRQDLDFQNSNKNRYQDFKYDPLDIQGNIQKMNQINMQRKSTVVSKDKSQLIHFQKTQRKMRSFISSYFYQDLFSPNQKLYHKIYITDMKFNQKKTVVSIFWSFQDASLSQNKEQLSKMTKKLQKSAPFMSGKMTQVLGLRYGPDIRFLYDQILPQTQQIKQSLQQNKEEVIGYQLQNLINKGHIKTQKQFLETKKKLQIVARQNIDNYHNRKMLVTKKFKKSQQPKQTKKGKKKQKKKADQRFWQHIDKL